MQLYVEGISKFKIIPGMRGCVTLYFRTFYVWDLIENVLYWMHSKIKSMINQIGRLKACVRMIFTLFWLSSAFQVRSPVCRADHVGRAKNNNNKYLVVITINWPWYVSSTICSKGDITLRIGLLCYWARICWIARNFPFVGSWWIVVDGHICLQSINTRCLGWLRWLTMTMISSQYLILMNRA